MGAYLKANDFFNGAWLKCDGEPFETWSYDNTLCVVTGKFEDYSFREIPIEKVEPILLFDSIIPAFGLEIKGRGFWQFKHYNFLKSESGGYNTVFGNIKYIHELQRIMICFGQSGIVFNSDIKELSGYNLTSII